MQRSELMPVKLIEIKYFNVHDPPSDQSAHPTVVIAGVVVAIVEAGEVVECAKIKVWSMFIFNSIECVIGNV